MGPVFSLPLCVHTITPPPTSFRQWFAKEGGNTLLHRSYQGRSRSFVRLVDVSLFLCGDDGSVVTVVEHRVAWDVALGRALETVTINPVHLTVRVDVSRLGEADGAVRSEVVNLVQTLCGPWVSVRVCDDQGKGPLWR